MDPSIIIPKYKIGGEHKLNTFYHRENQKRDINFGDGDTLNVLYDAKHKTPICNEPNMNYYVFRKQLYVINEENMDYKLQEMVKSAGRPQYNETIAHSIASLHESINDETMKPVIIVDIATSVEIIRNFHQLLTPMLNNEHNANLRPKQIAQAVNTSDCYPNNNGIRFYINHNTNYTQTIYHEIDEFFMTQKQDNNTTKRLYILRNIRNDTADRQLINGANQRNIQKIWIKIETEIKRNIFRMLIDLKNMKYNITPDIMINNAYLRFYDASYIELKTFVDGNKNMQNEIKDGSTISTRYVTRSWEHDINIKFNVHINGETTNNQDNRMKLGQPLGLNRKNQDVKHIISQCHRYLSYIPSGIDEEEKNKIQKMYFNMNLLRTHNDTNRYKTLSQQTDITNIHSFSLDTNVKFKNNSNNNTNKHRDNNTNTTQHFVNQQPPPTQRKVSRPRSLMRECKDDETDDEDNMEIKPIYSGSHRSPVIVLNITTCKHNKIDNRAPLAARITKENKINVTPNTQNNTAHNMLYLDVNKKQYILTFENNVICDIPGKTTNELCSTSFKLIKYQQQTLALLNDNICEQLKMYTLLIAKINEEILNSRIIKNRPHYYQLFKLLQCISGMTTNVTTIGLNHMPSLYDLIIHTKNNDEISTKHIYCVTYMNINTSVILLNFFSSTGIKDKLFAIAAIKKRTYDMENILFVIDNRDIKQAKGIDKRRAFEALFDDISLRSNRCFGCIETGVYTEQEYDGYLEQLSQSTVKGHQIVREIKNKVFVDEIERDNEFIYLNLDNI